MEPLVRARGLTGFSECVRAHGGDPEKILELAGLKSRELKDPLRWISFAAVLRAYQLASHLLREPAFGIRLVEFRDFTFLGPLLLVARHAETLRIALERVSRYTSIQNTSYSTSLTIHGTSAVRAYHLPQELRHGADQWIEESLMSSRRFISQLMAEDLPVTRYLMRHQPLRSRDDYVRDYGAPVLFGQQVDGLEFDGAFVDRQVLNRDAATAAFISGYLDERVLPSGGDIEIAARNLLETLIPMSQARLEIVAEYLKLHPRTLQRRLQATGFSFPTCSKTSGASWPSG